MANLPLSRIRVLDLTLIWAGPHAVMMLGDLGAEIIRVESTNHHITNTRGFVAKPTKELVGRLGYLGSLYADLDPKDQPWNRHAMFNSMGRNKKSMTVDMTTPEGRDILYDLIRISDVLVENQAMGMLARFGLGYQDARRLNPALIYMSMPIFGLSGPYKDYLGFGVNGDAMTGVLWQRGYPGQDISTAGVGNYMDAASGITASYAVMAALFERDRTGKGQFVEFCQLEHLVTQIGGPIMDAAMNGRALGSTGNRDPIRAPQGFYPCEGHDRWIAISVGADAEWASLCRALGQPALEHDTRFSDPFLRQANHDALDAIIGEWSRGMDARHAMEQLQQQGVPAGMAAQDPDLLEDPQLAAREFFHEKHHAATGTYRFPGHFYKMSATPPRFETPPPLLGEHNGYVYSDLLGKSSGEIQQLTERGHIGTSYTEHMK